MKNRLLAAMLFACLSSLPVYAQGTGGGGGAVLTPFAGAPTGTCTSTQAAVDTTTGNFYSCNNGTWLLIGPGAAGSASFATLTGGTNAGQSLLVGNSSTLATTGSGVINANQVNSHTPGGTCTNQFAQVIDSSGRPTCATVVAADTDTSIAHTGVDVNTSYQVTATHLAAALPVAQGGTGAATFAADNILGNFTGSTAGISSQAIPPCPNDGTHAIVYVSHTLTCEVITAATGTVTTTGSPASTYIANFSGATSITGSSAATMDGSGNGTFNTVKASATGVAALNLSTTTVVGLSSLTGLAANDRIMVTDSSDGTCGNGGGSTNVDCFYNGSTWKAIGPAATGGTVSGPGTTVNGDVASWSGTNGTTLQDAGFLASAVARVNVANTYTAGFTQTFQANATNPGASFSGVTADPSVPGNYGLWYRSDISRFKFYNGTSAQTIATIADIGSNGNPYQTINPSAGTLTWDWSVTNNIETTLVANTTLVINNPTNGVTGSMFVTQGGSGSYTLTLPSNAYTPSGGAGVITLSTSVGAIDEVSYKYDGANFFVHVVGLNYTAGSVANPTASPTTGTYNNNQSVTLSDATSGASILYTTNGSSPTHSGSCTPTGSTSTYSTALSVTATGTAIKALGCKVGQIDSGIQTFTYTLQGATPSFSPAGGTYSSTQSVTISTTTTSSTLLYTTDGTTPTYTGSCTPSGTTQTYSAPVSVATSLTLKALTCKANYADSSVGSAAYTISGQSPVAVDTTNQMVWNNSTFASTTTFTGFNLAANSSRVLILTCAADNVSTNPQAITSVTYGGVSMTQLGTRVDVSSGAGSGPEWTGWYIKEANLPSNGTHSFVLTNASSSIKPTCGASTFYNVDQTNVYAGFQSGAASVSGSPNTLTVASATNDLVIESGGEKYNTLVSLDSSGTTYWVYSTVVNGTTYSGTDDGLAVDMLGSKTGASSVTLSATWTTGNIKMTHAGFSLLAIGNTQ